MKRTFEIECYIQDIKKVDRRYKVEIQTKDSRTLFFFIEEKDEEIHLSEVYSCFRMWHKKQVLMNTLSWILYSDQRTFLHKSVFQKEFYYNRSKIDMIDLNRRYRFIKSLPEIENWISSINRSESTKDTYRRVLRIFLKYLIKQETTLDTFGIGDIQSFFQTIEHKSEYYVEKVNCTIFQFIKSQRPELVKIYKEMVFITKPENLLGHAPRSLDSVKVNEIFRELEKPLYVSKEKGNKVRYFESLRNLTIIHLLFDLGIRLSELTNLNTNDLEIGKTSKTSTIRIKGKRNKIRYIPIPNNSRKWLNKYLIERDMLLREKKVKMDAVFISNQLNRISSRSVYRILSKFNTHPHAARHTLITKLIRKGNDLVSVKEIAGHSNISSTARYSKPTFDQIADMLDS